MKNIKLQQQIVELRIMLQNICDGFSAEKLNKATNLTMRTKVLFVLSKSESCSPSTLIETLGIAKSNLALLCKSMAQEGVIDVIKSKEDKRNIYYALTPKGENELNKFYVAMSAEVDVALSEREMRIIEKKFDEIIDFLNKKYN